MRFRPCVGARFFDLLDSTDILRAIEDVFIDDAPKRQLIEAGARRLEALPTWPEVYASFKGLIHELLYGPARAAQSAASVSAASA